MTFSIAKARGEQFFAARENNSMRRLFAFGDQYMAVTFFKGGAG